jgi:hypothetical protein
MRMARVAGTGPPARRSDWFVGLTGTMRAGLGAAAVSRFVSFERQENRWTAGRRLRC